MSLLCSLWSCTYLNPKLLLSFEKKEGGCNTTVATEATSIIQVKGAWKCICPTWAPSLLAKEAAVLPVLLCHWSWPELRSGAYSQTRWRSFEACLQKTSRNALHKSPSALDWEHDLQKEGTHERDLIATTNRRTHFQPWDLLPASQFAWGSGSPPLRGEEIGLGWEGASVCINVGRKACCWL